MGRRSWNEEVRVFGVGMPELLVILVVALLVLGPKRLPEIARSLGKGMAEFRKASTEFQRTLSATLEEPPPAAPPRAPAASPAEKPAAAAPAPTGPKTDG
jgi:TatA/E family protein of Tat protein translocase